MTLSLFRQLRTAQRVAALLTGLMGLLGVVGWITGGRPFVALSPDLVSMKFNTALGLLVIGGALVLLRDRPGWNARLLGAAAALLGALTTIEYLTGVDLRIDDLFIRHPVGGNGAFPGRMSFITAMLFTILGSGIVVTTLGSVRAGRWGQRLALAAFGITTLTILGYAQGLTVFLRDTSGWTAVALNASVGTALAAVALLWSHPIDPEHGDLLSDPGLAGSETRRFVFLLLPALFLALTLTRVGLDLLGARSDVTEAIRNLLLILAAGWAVGRTLSNLSRAHRELESEVRHRTAELRAALEGAELGLWELEFTTGEMRIDEGGRAILGRELPADTPFPSRELTARIHPEDLPHYEEQLAAHRRDPAKLFEATYRLRQPDGGWRWAETKGRAVARAAGGAPRRMLGVVVDITPGKVLEGIATQQRRDLETLLYVASHDLREPLRAIENFSLIVRNEYGDRLDDRARDLLDRVVRAAVRLHRLLEDLQGVAKAQGVGLELRALTGASVVQDALGRVEHRAREVGAVISVADHLPDLFVDPVWATQALYNLVVNALKFTIPGIPPVVHIAGLQREGQVGLSVEDRGPGVPVEIHESIFELFRRGVGRDVEGTGAGLAIVRQVADRHGGRAWVEDRDGGGSMFCVTFGAPPLLAAG